MHSLGRLLSVKQLLRFLHLQLTLFLVSAIHSGNLCPGPPRKEDKAKSIKALGSYSPRWWRFSLAWDSPQCHMIVEEAMGVLLIISHSCNADADWTAALRSVHGVCIGRSGNLCNASKSWASAYWTYSTILQPRLRPRHRLPVLCFGAPLIGLFSIFVKQCDAHLHCISFSSAEFLQLFKLRTMWPTMLHLWLVCWSACSGKTSLLLQFAYNCALRSEGTVTFMCRPHTFDLDPPCLSQVTP